MLPSSSSSHSTTHSNCNSRLFMGFSPCIRGFPLFSPANQPATANLFSVNRPSWAKNGRFSVGFHLQRSAISKPRTEEYKDVFQNGLSVIKWREIMDDDLEEDILKEVSTSNQIEERVESIRGMLGRMDDGEISVSAYDTAWVAMVQDVNGSGAPQFPTSLRWIADNQLPDGSWGDYYIFSAHDRIINTLACVIALKSWNTHPEKIEKGVLFIKENMKKLSEESDEHMPIGFEVAFPSLIEIARNLNIEIPDDSPVFQRIYAMRDLKLKRIPKDIMHLVPTTLLHSLEGMPNLEWEKLLKLQSTDGSFLFSPSSTAFALIQTQDDHCLAYLSKAVQKFNGGVPNVYPVDLFEHIWVVDRLERLGISRYFRSEIKECVDYVSRYWTREGICWARNSRVRDIDDTAMGFRLLRLHGYDASADVFEHFESDGEFFCFAGQSTQAVTGMFNLYRASQVAFPGEKILEDAKNFSSKFLREKQACNKLLDKWIITKDLPGEVGYALEVPWYASLPRVETRFYLEQYGGDDDVWIGKTLYRMPYVNNNTYLELAKLDFNDCQALHQLEWKSIQKWYEECGLGEFGMGKRGLLSAYYLAAASVFEPERSKERLAWAKTVTLVQTIGSHFQKNSTSYVDRKAFVHEFRNSTNGLHYLNGRRYKTTQQSLSRTLLATLNQLSLDALVAHGRDIHRHLRRAWDTWMMTWQEGGDVYQVEAELLVRTLDLCAGRWESEEILSDPQYRRLSEITNRVCRHLRLFQRQRQEIKKKPCGMMREEIEGSMQEMVQVVVSQSSSDNTNGGLPSDIKQTFLTVARSFYYSAHCDPGTINSHIVKVLFERVL